LPRAGRAEWRLALPHHHYFHVAAGIAEFVFGTVAVYLAWQRTRSQESPVTRPSGGPAHHGHRLPPLLGVAYLTTASGAFVEPIFFTCFSVMVLTRARRDGPHHPRQPSAGHPGGPGAAVPHDAAAGVRG